MSAASKPSHHNPIPIPSGDSPPLRDWLVTFAHKVALERDYTARHPGHVFLVMLRREEAEGLLEQVNALVQEGEG